MFQTSTYIHRRSALVQGLGNGLFLFLGNEESPMNYADNTYRFRQDSTFLYYFGIGLPGLAALVDSETGTSTLFGDEMTMDHIVWMGRQKTLAAWAEESGIDAVQPARKLQRVLEEAAAAGRAIHFLPPYRAENKMRLAALTGMHTDVVASQASVSFVKAVIAQRSVKSGEEIEELDLASNISARMHLAAMQQARPGMFEYELAATIHREALAGGGDLAYPIILTVNGQILHNHHHGNLLREGRLVLNDSGAETARCYAGDLTRTFPVAKKFTALQKDLYNLVLAAYRDAVAILRPGVRYLDVHFQACTTLARGLTELGLMKGNPEQAVQAGAHALFFQCGTGHMMGLDVHDMEDLGEQYVGYSEDLKKNTALFGLKSLRLGKELQQGYVLTVEPGLYFIPELIDQWRAEKRFSEFINYDEAEKYRDFGGIRVEDDYVITADAARKLGDDLIIEAADIERVREAAF
ncbi:Xaa-Pro aminopeptidase [Pedobacter yulinensis]|uniref:Xaa-Pro aminopeptidase n=1 Tax=Pedobacter yulinensis TaxID=2126353 RepID=A0A2T3HQI4_9SPHI|nr:aminopeptidase P family protein [Pedobacter yulinensis]PST84689.1 Xaa-Pro aminopeptidase [Pedobacter yulinensis]